MEKQASRDGAAASELVVGGVDGLIAGRVFPSSAREEIGGRSEGDRREIGGDRRSGRREIGGSSEGARREMEPRTFVWPEKAQ